MYDSSKPDRLLSKEDLRRLLPYSNDHLRRLERAGLFPRRVRLGTGRIGWSEREVTEWIEARKSARVASESSDTAELEGN